MYNAYLLKYTHLGMHLATRSVLPTQSAGERSFYIPIAVLVETSYIFNPLIKFYTKSILACAYSFCTEFLTLNFAVWCPQSARQVIGPAGNGAKKEVKIIFCSKQLVVLLFVCPRKARVSSSKNVLKSSSACGSIVKNG